MPKSVRRRGRKRENWFWNGFVAGGVFGLILAVGVRSYSSSLLTVTISRFIFFVCFVLAFPLTLYNAYYRKALLSPFGEGIIAGIGFTAQVLEWALHGVQFP